MSYFTHSELDKKAEAVHTYILDKHAASLDDQRRILELATARVNRLIKGRERRYDLELSMRRG